MRATPSSGSTISLSRAARAFPQSPTPYVAVAKERFAEVGWEGKGDIGLLWLPPFVFRFDPKVPTKGVVVWHVKQVEDGTSWLMSPIPLPFEKFTG